MQQAWQPAYIMVITLSITNRKKIDDIPVFIKYDTIIYVFIDYTWNSLEPAYKKNQSYFIRPAILLLEFLMFF